MSEQFRRLTRHASELERPGELAERLNSRRALRVKFGVDPTAPAVTLGWSVPLRRLRRFQEYGHQAVLIVGDFTAQIGDPSGANADRPMLDRKSVEANAAQVFAQFGAILDMDRVEIRYNSEWLEPLGSGGLLELASTVTVAQTLSRDDFSRRHEAGRPISLKEFLYPVLQSYDSVAVRADVEIGGNDQLYTFLLAREVMRHHGLPPQVVMTLPLLVGTDGSSKMSQSKGNYVAICEEPSEMFGKLMRLPDERVGDYLRLATDLDDPEVDEILTLRPDLAKRRLAREVITLYHGPDAASGADDEWERRHVRRELPGEPDEAVLPPDLVQDGKVYLPRLLHALGLAASASDARRLIAQGGVRIDSGVVTQEWIVSPVGKIVQVGRRGFVRVISGV